MDAAGLGLARLAQLSRHRPLTVADIESLDRSVGRVELLDGVLLVTPHADVDHPRWARRLANRLDELVPPGCEALDGVNVFEPGSDRVCVIPDVVVIQTDKIVQVPRQGEGVFPDGLELVIEITSSNRDVDLGVKRQRYQAWGVPYLVVDRSTDRTTILSSGSGPTGLPRSSPAGENRDAFVQSDDLTLRGCGPDPTQKPSLAGPENTPGPSDRRPCPRSCEPGRPGPAAGTGRWATRKPPWPAWTQRGATM